MDTEKLFKAIQIVVKEEVKRQVEGLKEQVRKEVLAEIRQTSPTTKTRSLKSVVSESSDPFKLAQQILSADRQKKEERQFTKNPAINQILNETVVKPNFSKDDGSWGTLPTAVGLGNTPMGSASAPKTGIDSIDKAIARSAAVLAASKAKRD